MSLHLIPASRRQFLQTAVSAGLVTFTCRSSSAAAPRVDPHRWALLADTHVAADANTVARGVNMFDNLNRIIDEVLAEEWLPAGAIINGDCAYLKGLEGDYRTLESAIERLVRGGVPVHMTMGNHDDRGPFFSAFANHKPDRFLVEGKHVTVIETEHANFFLVDSLKEVNVVTGQLGDAQLQWLGDALRKHHDKPAIVVGHHNPQYEQDPSKQVSGLLDTAKFIHMLDSIPHAHGYVYGHTHDWRLTKTPGGKHLINQPPCAYVFNESRPAGWVRLILNEDAFSIELRALDQAHPQHGERHTLDHNLAAAK